jgi:hypothetical protein
MMYYLERRNEIVVKWWQWRQVPGEMDIYLVAEMWMQAQSGGGGFFFNRGGGRPVMILFESRAFNWMV